MKVHTCTYCNKGYTGRKKKFCSKRCLMNATNDRYRSDIVQRECKSCGTIFETNQPEHKHFACSTSCKDKLRNARRKDYMKAFRKEYSKTYDGPLYPKPKCVPTLRSKVFFNVCEITGQLFTAKRRTTRISREGRIIQIKNNPYYNKVPTHIKACIECNKEYKGTTTTKYCSKECCSKYHRRIRKSKERARLRNATVEHVDPFKVFNHYKWKCCSCGCKTPRNLRGTSEDNAPELDHIIPLSKGGEHSYRNVQLLCRKCNNNKLDSVLMIGYSTNKRLNINKGRGGLKRYSVY